VVSVETGGAPSLLEAGPLGYEDPVGATHCVQIVEVVVVTSEEVVRVSVVYTDDPEVTVVVTGQIVLVDKVIMVVTIGCVDPGREEEPTGVVSEAGIDSVAGMDSVAGAVS
jgi:hypothetical protein